MRVAVVSQTGRGHDRQTNGRPGPQPYVSTWHAKQSIEPRLQAPSVSPGKRRVDVLR